MFVLSFDPGKTTGYCYQDEHKVYKMDDTRNLDETLEKIDLSKTPVDHVVIENYRVREDTIKMNVGVPLETVENIGVIKSWCRRKGISFTEYEPKLKPAQCKMTQVFPKKMSKSIEHKFDAFNHGRYYLIKLGLAKTALEEEMGI